MVFGEAWLMVPATTGIIAKVVENDRNDCNCDWSGNLVQQMM
jgi:hypothetical protein